MGFFDKIKAGLEKTRRQMGGVFAAMRPSGSVASPAMFP